MIGKEPGDRFQQNEENLMANEERYRNFVESLPQPVAEMDIKGNITFVNRTGLTIFGYTKEDFDNGLNMYQLIAPEDRERARRKFQELANGQEEDGGEYAGIRKDGSELHFAVYATPVFHKNRPVGFSAIFVDITERRQVEKTLRENEEKFREMFETIEDLYYEADAEGIVKVLSPSVHRLSGWDAKNLIGKSAASFYDDPRDREALRLKLREQGYVHDYEIVLRAKDGEKRQVSLSARVIVDAGGQPTGVRGLLRDITERKLAEEALRESEGKYRSLVEKANEAICIVQDDVLVFVNHRMSELLGVPIRDLEDRPFSDFIWPEDREMMIAKYRKRIAGEDVKDAYDFRYIGLGHRLMWAFVSATAIRWKGKPATLNLITDITDRKLVEEEREKLIADLKEALSQVKILKGLLPICASCKRIRNEKGDWEQMETYIRDRSEAKFSHGICPECAAKLYPDFYKKSY